MSRTVIALACYSFDNVIICTHAEASQHNKRNLAHYNPKFTKHVHTKLLMPTVKVSSQSDPKEGLYTDPYPPKSEFNHRVSSNVMSWLLRNFQVPQPIAHNPSRYSRYARLSRLPEATLVACNWEKGWIVEKVEMIIPYTRSWVSGIPESQLRT